MPGNWLQEIEHQIATARDAGVAPAPEQALAFSLEAESGDQARALEAELAARWGDRAVAEPLFADLDSEDKARFTRLVFPDVDADLAEPVAYEMAYGLADDLKLRSAEPDIPAHFYFQPGEPAEASNPESAVVGAFCEVKKTNPPPPAHWAVEMVRAKAAIAYSTAQGRPAGGAGMVVAQPDTGVVPNAELEAGALDPGLGWDVLADPPRAGAHDPLAPGNPGHGTATSSTVVSRGAGVIMGSAPAAQVYPIRCTKAVVIFNAIPVARAIEKATTVGADVITMSLGGVPNRSVKTAIKRAREAGVIVMAAAGNCVGVVVWPARYSTCIAVAGCNSEEKAWKGSCRGGPVDITAPAERVWHASATDPKGHDDGQGTSFAVALTAGAAAQWVAHHGRAAVRAEAASRDVTVADLFRKAIKQTANPSSHLDPGDFGPGILDIEKLLKLDLKDIGPAKRPVETEEDDPDVTPPEYEDLLRQFGPGAEAAAIDWRRYGAEVGTVGLRRAVSARAEGVELAESAPAPATGDLRQAAHASGNPALINLVGG